jgi:hypothetical protein
MPEDFDSFIARNTVMIERQDAEIERLERQVENNDAKSFQAIVDMVHFWRDFAVKIKNATSIADRQILAYECEERANRIMQMARDRDSA